jgi:hypothetical protein
MTNTWAIGRAGRRVHLLAKVPMARLPGESIRQQLAYVYFEHEPPIAHLVVITKNTDNDQIVSLLPHRYRVAGAFLRKCVRAPRGDGPSSAWMNCGLSADLIGSRLLFLGEIWENDGRTSHAAIGF